MNILDTNIKDLMAVQVITIATSDSLLRAKELMQEHHINHLPVTQNDEIVGMISSNDLKKVEYISDFVGGKTSKKSSFSVVDVEELMTTGLTVLDEESQLKDAVKLFSQNNFQALPIVKGTKLVGILTTKDVFSFFLKESL